MEGLTLPGRGSGAEATTASDLRTLAGSPPAAAPNQAPWWPRFILSLAVRKGCVCSRGWAAAGSKSPTLGRLGTGGTWPSRRAGERCGDGERKVRSIMEPTLGLLWRSHTGSLSRLACDDADGLLRWARLVCTSATLVGVCGRARRAAAAAADESEALESRRIKADAAAVAALGLAVSLVRGCRPSAPEAAAVTPDIPGLAARACGS